jgi:hypothetical protein
MTHELVALRFRSRAKCHTITMFCSPVRSHAHWTGRRSFDSIRYERRGDKAELAADRLSQTQSSNSLRSVPRKEEAMVSSAAHIHYL